jgi:hypothetical protein
VDLESYIADVFPSDTRTRIEVDPQFIGIIEICGPNRVWVQFNTAKIHNPNKPGGSIHHKLFRSFP